jgi:polygalacturonase
VAYSITTAPAPIFSDYAGSTPKSNPATCDSTGYFFFYAANSTLDLKFSGTGITTPFTLAAVSGIDPLTIPLTVSSRSYIAAGLTFYQACASAAAQGLTLVIDQTWYGIATSATCAAAVQGGSGNIQPASGQTVTLTGSITAGASQIFDVSSGGTISFAGNTNVATVFAQWFGVKGDGVTDNGPYFAAATSALNSMGGGKLVIAAAASPYMFNTGTPLYSNVTVEIQAGAIVKRVNSQGGTCYGGQHFGCYSAFWSIYSSQPSNVHIVGGGIIDGNRSGNSGAGAGGTPDIMALGWNNSSIEGITIQNSESDGIGIFPAGADSGSGTNNGDNLLISGVTIKNATRNGVSHIGGTHVTMRDSHIT